MTLSSNRWMRRAIGTLLACVACRELNLDSRGLAPCHSDDECRAPYVCNLGACVSDREAESSDFDGGSSPTAGDSGEILESGGTQSDAPAGSRPHTSDNGDGGLPGGGQPGSDDANGAAGLLSDSGGGASAGGAFGDGTTDSAQAGGASGEGGGQAIPGVQPFTYAVLPTSLVRDRCLFDADRLAVYTNNWAQYFGPAGVRRVERHRFREGAWLTDSLLLDGPPRDIAFTRDHRRLIAISPSTLYEINLDTWKATSRVDLSGLEYPNNISSFSRIAVIADSKVLALLDSTQVLYDLGTHTFSAPPGASPSLFGSIAPVASADGSRILFGQNGTSGPLKLYYYDTTLAQFVVALPDLTVNRMSYARDASTAIIDGAVFDRDFQIRGIATDLLVSVISPDGTRGYGFVDAGTPEGRTLHTYDVTKGTSNGGLEEAAPPISIPDAPGDFATLGITDDGKTVFVSGEANFIVQPVL
jgi:hypothetical protein